jgi:uncharacterized protein YheU (UPF0270 family)
MAISGLAGGLTHVFVFREGADLGSDTENIPDGNQFHEPKHAVQMGEAVKLRPEQEKLVMKAISLISAADIDFTPDQQEKLVDILRQLVVASEKAEGEDSKDVAVHEDLEDEGASDI